ncbi:MAG TPA: hypothetical protein VGF67_25945 [Ktedonobacteraceae bacterium]
MKDASSSFLPTFFPRLLATFSVLSLIGVLSLSCILGVALIGPALSHGEHVNHAAGQIISIGPGRNFVLLTGTGKRLAFQCTADCRASLGHMLRHLNEHAHTDVYYVDGANKTLMALDVD